MRHYHSRSHDHFEARLLCRIHVLMKLLYASAQVCPATSHSAIAHRCPHLPERCCAVHCLAASGQIAASLIRDLTAIFRSLTAAAMNTATRMNKAAWRREKRRRIRFCVARGRDANTVGACTSHSLTMKSPPPSYG